MGIAWLETQTEDIECEPCELTEHKGEGPQWPGCVCVQPESHHNGRGVQPESHHTVSSVQDIRGETQGLGLEVLFLFPKFS